ncbi:hypothetical protein [Sodalinema gerasimenkoae]|uniref:hypothetical protein n=1 Tax=Sodalinema gerasimenkoae TaxID=2862348 RepID=UPI0013594E3E|nr:hypothetical protein [Sodalinema gerasimenkoae]
MEADSQSARSEQPPGTGLAQWVGTLIAVLTLTLPLFVIFVYSARTVNLPTSEVSDGGDRVGELVNLRLARRR